MRQLAVVLYICIYSYSSLYTLFLLWFVILLLLLLLYLYLYLYLLLPAVEKVKEAWVNQTFLGKRCTFGDDRALSNYLLKER